MAENFWGFHGDRKRAYNTRFIFGLVKLIMAPKISGHFSNGGLGLELTLRESHDSSCTLMCNTVYKYGYG